MIAPRDDGIKVELIYDVSYPDVYQLRIQSLDRTLQIPEYRIGVFISDSMASLVDSRPTSVPLPQSQSPPIKTTTNTLPQAPQLQPQSAGSTPSPFLEIPGAFPHDTSRPSPRQNTSETSRGQASQSRTSFLTRERGFVTQS